VLGLRYDWRGSALVTLHNFSAQKQSVALKLAGPASERLVNVFQDEANESDRQRVHHFKLDGYA
jgi:maltose alpha-D-glucosyltransferase/alpha-amylase